MYAVACIAAASRAGLSVPGEVAIIGMDDEAVSAYTLPALTTIRLHVMDFAHHLWTRASAVLDGGPAPERASSMLFSLVQRQSA
jgi:DNA-binding LacI/PurR family transcriptional regulator